MTKLASFLIVSVLITFVAAICLLLTGCATPLTPDYTCLTKPRPYVHKATGEIVWLQDTYTQAEPCPAEMIP